MPHRRDADYGIAISERTQRHPAGDRVLLDGGELGIGDGESGGGGNVDRAAISEPGLNDDLLAVAGRVQPESRRIDLNADRLR